MPTTVSRQELDELRDLINRHIEQSGESVTSIAKRAGVRRAFVSNIRNGNFETTFYLENVRLIGAAIGKRLKWVDE